MTKPGSNPKPTAKPKSSASSSTDTSCDSLREVSTSSLSSQFPSNVALLQQFLQKRSFLEKRKKRLEATKTQSQYATATLAKDTTELNYLHNESQLLSSDYEEAATTAPVSRASDGENLLGQSFHRGKGHFMELLGKQANSSDYAFQPIAATHSFHATKVQVGITEVHRDR